MHTSANPQHPRSALHLAMVVAIAVMALLVGCGQKKDPQTPQIVAKVNKEEITAQQLHFMLQQHRGLKPEQAEVAAKQILERMIDQELAVQKAEEMKLDREPQVVQQLQAARREIVARAFLEKAGEAASKPTPEEIQKYFDEHPALFNERRVYNLQEIAIEAKPEQMAELKTKLEASKNVADFIDYLKANDYRYAANQAVRAAEQLPLAGLENIAAMKDGQAILNASGNGARVIVLAGSRAQPVTLEQSRPAIEQFLLNERKREILVKDIKSLRDAAKIEYVGNFAEAAGSVLPATTTATAASSALDGASSSKGTEPTK